MYDEVMEVIRERLPEQSPEKLPTVYPPWEQAPAWIRISGNQVADGRCDCPGTSNTSTWIDNEKRKRKKLRHSGKAHWCNILYLEHRTIYPSIDSGDIEI
jgi:hypothetical protein